MNSYLTQTFLLCTAVVSIYILVHITNLAIHHPNTELIALAVQATVEALPTAKPIIVEVPVTVEVTRLVLASPQSTLPNTITVPTATQTPVPLVTVVSTSASAPAQTVLPPTLAPVATPSGVVLAAGVQPAAVDCATTSNNAYTLISMKAADTNHPDSQHGDLNLALRGYQPSNAAKQLVTYTGDVDAGAPQLTGLVPINADQRSVMSIKSVIGSGSVGNMAPAWKISVLIRICWRNIAQGMPGASAIAGLAQRRLRRGGGQ